MGPLTILAELVFLLIFVVSLVSYLRRPNPVRRDVALLFLPLAVLLGITAWRGLIGPVAPIVSQVGGVVFVLQPVFALHLVSLVRHVPRAVLVGAVIASVATGILAVAAGQAAQGLAVLAVGVFIGVEGLAALYLFLEARSRRGPGARRMYVAAASIALLAVALLIVIFGALAPTIAPITGAAASLSAVLAAFGCLAAFVPPGPIRRFWQAGPTIAFGERLIELAGAPVDRIWAHLADVGAAANGAGAAVIMTRRTSPAEGARAVGTVLASTGTAARPGHPIGPEELDELAALHAADSPIPPGGVLARLGAQLGARFASVVPIPVPDPAATAVLVLVAPYRSLFHDSDLALLATLGGQTAIVAERGAALAEQEATSTQLAATVDALQAASEAKSDFLASMSHELRTPLSAILGFSDLMRHEPVKEATVTVPLEWVEHVHRGGEHLLSLINDVLDLAKVEAGRLELVAESIEASAAIAEIVNGIRPLADRKRIALDADVPPGTLLADRGRFRQILYNLLSNAIKYTPDGGTVRLGLTAADGEVRVSVTDSGVGIAPEDHAAVFEEFRQVGDPGERQAGTGLGLALTRRLVEAHGGRIELVSERGVGSTFTVVLPGSYHSASESGGRSAPIVLPTDGLSAAPAGGAPVDVLVIEDDPSAARLLREYLEPSGFRVLTVTTGEDGLVAARRHQPAAIILDVLLPGIDGWDVIRQLKADPGLRDVPVVVVTVVDDRQVGLALGAVDYLVKPVDREALLGTLARFTFTTKVRHGPIRILAVDDEPAALDLVRHALEPEGFEVLTASGGREALSRVHEGVIDLVVCDLVMPDLDGFEVIAGLKADPSTAAIPILVCTAHDLSAADKARLNGQILGIVKKGADARDGLRAWLGEAAGTPHGP